MISTVQTIAFAFDYSTKRLLAFQESIDQNAQVREEMDRRVKLRTLCETRWASRADALYTFGAALESVGKARGYLCSIKQFDFIIALCAAEHILSNNKVALSTMLQRNSVDLIKAAQEARVVINSMIAERGDPSVWKEVYERGKQIAAEFDIRPCMPRTNGKQQRGMNVLAINPESYWQRAVYLPLGVAAFNWRTTNNSG